VAFLDGHVPGPSEKGNQPWPVVMWKGATKGISAAKGNGFGSFYAWGKENKICARHGDAAPSWLSFSIQGLSAWQWECPAIARRELSLEVARAAAQKGVQ
jgi:hypothetical protein